MDFASIGLPALLATFAAATVVVAVAGTRITRLADRLADETGLGEAMTGALLLGIATSLAGTVVSVSAALQGLASLAYANAIGGIAAQTAFLALADLVYRRANLEHASAELASILQAALLCLLLSLPLAAATVASGAVMARSGRVSSTISTTDWKMFARSAAACSRLALR